MSGGGARPRALLFDLDGTLADSVADLTTAVNEMRALHGLAPLSVTRVTGYVGDGLGKLAERALEGAPVDAALALRELSESYARHLDEQTRPMPGAAEGLAALDAAGYRLAVVTNKPAPHTRRVLAHLGFDRLLDAVVAGGDTPGRKPDPAPVLEALRRLDATPGEAWMVGDHHTDLEAARRAGVFSVFLSNGLGNTGKETPGRTFPGFAAFAAALTGRNGPNGTEAAG